MKRITRLLTAAFCLMSCMRNAGDVEVGPYTVSVIEKDIYHIQDYNSSNPAGESFDAEGKLTHFNNCSDIYLVSGKDKALLIDLSNKITWAEDAAESLRKIVSERTEGKNLIITFTHNHGDHIGMLDAFIDDDDVLFALPTTDFEPLIDRFPVADHMFIDDGHVFDLGGIEIESVAVPGHTDGSMVFNIKGRDILFSGDAVGSGHGVWIFNEDGFSKYASAVPELIEWIENPENGVNTDRLRIYGGHYWQKDWLPELKEKEMGMPYLYDMRDLINEMEDGVASTEPSGLGHPVLDTYFRHGSAIVVWNAAQAAQYSASKSE